MSATFGLVFPLWNMALDEELLERALGEVGFDHVVVPAVTGPVSEFRMYRPLEPQRVFQTRGGWHYPFQREHYASLIGPPPKAEWVTKRDCLGAVRDVVARRGLQLYLAVDVRAPVVDLGDGRYCNFQNAWGDTLRRERPCVLDPQVRALLQTTLDDLARYEPIGVELSGWKLDEGPQSVSCFMAPLMHRDMIEICFCPACEECASRAGQDADAVRDAVRRQHLAWADHGTTGSTSPEERRWYQLVNAYRECRCVEGRRWLDQLAGRYPQWRCLGPGNGPDPCYPLIKLPELQRWLPSGAVWDAGCEPGDEEIVRHGMTLVNLVATEFTEAAQLVRAVDELTRRGAEQIVFDGLTECLPDRLTWLKQAVRYARRGSG